MKLQNLAIIFLIIIIPIVSIFSLYLKLETKTITLQTDYDAKLIEATKEAVNAFEINTTEWNSKYSTLANVKRQDLLSSINVFIESLANKLGTSGMSKENILTYIPAIVFTMYDGYYIYAPTYVPQTITDDKGVQLFYYKDAEENNKITNSATQNIGGKIYSGEPMYIGTGLMGTYNGESISFTTEIEEAEKTYKHVLKTFVPYTTNYTINGKNYVINYTLDNYIRIYGKDISLEGYVIEDTDKIEISEEGTFGGIKFNDKTILPEILKENIVIDNVEKEYIYIYNSNNDKRYYDEETGKFFTVSEKYNDENNRYEYKRVDLPIAEVNTAIAEYKKVLVCVDKAEGDYIELYQLINGNDTNWYYRNNENEYMLYNKPISIDKERDCSAINYYVETYCFNKWLTGSNGLNLNKDNIKEIMDNKNQKIINNINNNLNLSISNYSANSKIDYKMTELSDNDWEQALSNISMIAFFQGKKIGLKTYNNYVVVSSEANNEFVSEDSLYYIGASEDNYYHVRNCNQIKTKIQSAYKNTDFKVRSYGKGENIEYYYKHNDAIQGCFDCIVNRNNYTKVSDTNEYDQIFYEALGRERFVQMSKMNLVEKSNNKVIITTVKFEGNPYFDGNRGQIISPAPMNGGATAKDKDTMMINATFKLESLTNKGGEQTIVGAIETSGWTFVVNDDNVIRLTITNDKGEYPRVKMTEALKIDTMYNVTAIYNDGEITFYLYTIDNNNVSLIESISGSIDSKLNQRNDIPTMIGANPKGESSDSSEGIFNGKIYNVKIWYDQIFTEEQIKRMAENALKGN